MNALQYIAVFLLGGAAYGLMELLWRGRTHWTMLLLGGVCFLYMYLVSARADLAPAVQYALCALFITAAEFLTGALVNGALGWAVWDYSALPMNLYGQICARYSLLWFLLSIPGCALARLLRDSVFPLLL